MGARKSLSCAVWLSLAAALAVPTACAGRSTSLESENAAGEGSGGTGGNGGAGGSTTGSGATGAVGGTGSGATGAVGGTGSGATGATGSGATGAVGGTGSGATGATGSGATGSGAAGGVTAGMGGTGIGGMTSCQMPMLDDRRCRIDSDCRLSGESVCCGRARLYGVANVTGCTLEPFACVADCAGTQWITDTNEATFDLDIVRVRCEIGEPGAGVCVSYIDLDPPPPPTFCDGELCKPEEVCVHYATPGGPQPPCVPLADGGTCPPDSVPGACPDSGAPGCISVPLAPPPQCVAMGAACGGSVDCDCLPDDICGGPATQCTAVMGHDVNCVDLAP